jgi:L-lactate dehydrogenase complex protein LldF
MAAASWGMRSPGRFAAGERALRAGRLLARGGRIRSLPPPLSAWTASRDLPAPPQQTFRQWWAHRSGPSS